MKIAEVKSLELDRTVAFNHCIRFKDVNGKTLELIKVKESVEWEQFKIIYTAWCKHPDFNGRK